VYQVGKETKYSQMMHGQPSIKIWFCLLENHKSKSVVTVQRAFRAKYAKDPPTDKTIRAWYKQFNENGCLCKQKSSGRPLTAEDDVERVPCHPWCTHQTFLVVKKKKK